MSDKELIIKYIVDFYINMKKRHGEDLRHLRGKFEKFLSSVCNNYDEIEEIIKEYHADDMDEIRQEFGEEEDGQSLMELEQEEYYSNVIAPQKF